ncbi:YIP1 family protein [Halodesulfovibrio sp.]|jgi:hypothetical protein|uniref:YIP1 family protein n=1 Tax=Halodesulfovibrio sp. TaxID=1912772 RepID=UPI0025D637D2|nr:YIP1 family protein [Halodesulfovibrio sp.]MCT4626282.1 YIP1 family protein [Halodesulfovibrio sp.]
MPVTLLEPYLRPTKFFSAQHSSRSLLGNLLFAVTVFASIPFLRIGLGNIVGMLGERYFDPHVVIFAFSLWQTPLAAAQQQVMLVPFYAIGLLLFGIWLHGLLWLAGGKKASFTATMQCVCYAAPCFCLTIFPYSGTLTAEVYFSIFLAYSLRATHDTRWSRVLPAVALSFPVVFIVGNLLFP